MKRRDTRKLIISIVCLIVGIVCLVNIFARGMTTTRFFGVLLMAFVSFIFFRASSE